MLTTLCTKSCDRCVTQVRQGLKKYSKWPTYPQLYVRGELIGGLDIVKVVLLLCVCLCAHACYIVIYIHLISKHQTNVNALSYGSMGA